MASAAAFLEAITALCSVVAALPAAGKLRGKKREKAEEAYRSLKRAALWTRAYLADLRDGPRGRDRIVERQLSQAWARAGHSIRLVGAEMGDLERRFFLKAEFWSDPKSWTRGRIAQADIQLAKIEEDAERLLGRRR